MNSSPIPTLPPASQLCQYNWFPPDWISPIRRYHKDLEAQNLVYDCWDSDSVSQKFSLLRQALRIFPFSVDALNAWANLYFSSCDPQELLKAEATYEMALTAARLLWPELEHQEKVEWGHIEHRPFLRAYHGLGVIQCELGKYEEAVKKFRFLLKVNPSDNQGARSLLFDTLIRIGEYKQAEDAAEEHSNGRKSTDAYFCYGFVLIDFLKFKLGVCSEIVPQKTLVHALSCNNYVPSILLGDIKFCKEPTSVPPGSKDEAISFVWHCKPSWDRTPGILEWLREQQQLDGPKPYDNGAVLFQLLQKGKVLVQTKNPHKIMELTSKVDLIPGTALPDFYLAPGMKNHNPAKIVAYKHEVSRRQRFVSFPYENVVSVHFWKILQNSNGCGDDPVEHSCRTCYKPATYRCSACNVVWYCSQACQRTDWKSSHKIICPRLQKT